MTNGCGLVAIVVPAVASVGPAIFIGTVLWPPAFRSTWRR